MRSCLFLLLLSGAAVLVADGPKNPAAAGPPDRLEVPPPPFSDGIFPCTNCHAGMPVDRSRRELTAMHTDIVLKHDETHRWCLDCHDAINRDVLHLASVHGRRTGNWNGAKGYLLCAHCHNPHQPRFKALAPKPAPQRPNRSMK